MQPLKISRQLSQTSRPHPKKLIFWTGSILVALGVLWLATPFIIRAHRPAITGELSRIATLSENEREVPLKRLFNVTGGDQVVARALASDYSQRGLHALAGQTYERARGALFLDAAQEYSRALRYTDLARVSQKATQQKPTAESLAWQGIGFLNQGSTEKGCEKSREALAKDQNHQLAKTVAVACEYSQRGESDPWKLTSVQLDQVALTKLQQSQDLPSAGLVLRASLQQRKEDMSAAIESLKQAFQQTPYDRDVLQTILNVCSAEKSDCGNLATAASDNQKLLPTR